MANRHFEDLWPLSRRSTDWFTRKKASYNNNNNSHLTSNGIASEDHHHHHQQQQQQNNTLMLMMMIIQLKTTNRTKNDHKTLNVEFQEFAWNWSFSMKGRNGMKGREGGRGWVWGYWREMLCVPQGGDCSIEVACRYNRYNTRSLHVRSLSLSLSPWTPHSQLLTLPPFLPIFPLSANNLTLCIHRKQIDWNKLCIQLALYFQLSAICKAFQISISSSTICLSVSVSDKCSFHTHTNLKSPIPFPPYSNRLQHPQAQSRVN